MISPEKDDRVRFANAPKERSRTVIFVITALEDDSLTIRPVGSEHEHTMSIQAAEQLGMEFA